MPTSAEIESFYAELLQKREEISVRRQAWSESVPYSFAVDGSLMGLLGRCAQAYLGAYQSTAGAPVDPKKFAAWHVMVLSTPDPEKLEYLDFPAPFALAPYIDALVEGSVSFSISEPLRMPDAQTSAPPKPSP